MKLNLSAKIVLSVLLTVAITFLAGFYFIVQKEQEFIITRMKEEAAVISEMISDNAEDAFGELKDERNLLQQLAQQLHDYEKLAWIEIFDSNGVIAAHTNKTLVGGMPRPAHLEYVRQVMERGEPVETEEPHSQKHIRFLPLYSGDEGSSEISGVMEVAVKIGPGMNEAKERVSDFLRMNGTIAGRVLNELKGGQMYIQHMTEQVGQFSDVKWVEIFNRNATIVAHTNRERIGQKPLPIHETFVRKVLETGMAIEEEDDQRSRLNRFVPYFIYSREENKRPAGVIEVVMDMNPITEKLDALQDRAAAIALILLTVIIGTLLLLLRYLVLMPVAELGLASREMASGQLDRRVNIARRDELGELATAFNNMADHIKDSQSLLSRSEKKYRRLFQSSTDAIIIHDEGGRIVDANNMALELFGYSRSKMASLNVRHIQPESSYAYGQKSCEQLAEEGLVHYEINYQKKNGDIFPAEVSIGYFEWDGQRLIQGIIRDITERRKAEESLKKAKEIADKASAAKSEFLTNMSHEIRTPMQAIIGLADILSETKLSREQMESVEIIEKAGNNLLDIINNILDLSRIEAGRYELENVEFSLSMLLEMVCKICGYRANEKGLKLTYKVERGTPEYLMGGKVYLQQILINLVGNAIKFTKKGEVKVAVRVDSQPPVDQQGVCRLLFSITDTGIGIPSHKLDDIFEHFTQADATTTRLYGGTGLGATISKNLVEKMGGRIWAESEVDKGSTFSFTVNLIMQEELKHGSPESAAREEKLPSDERPLSILLVEDTEDNLLLLRIFFKKAPYTLHIAENGEVALEKFKTNSYHLVLMDMEMPVMDGYTATREIRAWERRNNKEETPILALTAHALTESKQKSIDAGCTAHITKPIKKKELLQAVYQYARY